MFGNKLTNLSHFLSHVCIIKLKNNWTWILGKPLHWSFPGLSSITWHRFDTCLPVTWHRPLPVLSLWLPNSPICVALELFVLSMCHVAWLLLTYVSLTRMCGSLVGWILLQRSVSIHPAPDFSDPQEQARSTYGVVSWVDSMRGIGNTWWGRNSPRCAFRSITSILTYIFAPRVTAASFLCLYTEMQPAACSWGNHSMDWKTLFL